ncbi:hypothetical protein [Paenibacillus crassostreae]|uniref:Uncharacterized protein n=1 Tax=Paenibacillus crassostreae TaxID=1763538 RepID=A0A167AUB6_9BACL|nr:hypothetical protein [Paenibacillus crassostreae]AOZ93610.1 hypothetical protein LPB68_16375 [Paenibacillus crassostreae]OAB71437.1 hypothetical protein PNBC_19245 [Paenibacillus crassostreae]
MIRKPCKLDTDFQRSISFQREIEVWLDGELDTVGKVESFTDETVKIDGSYFIRENCKFWMI